MKAIVLDMYGVIIKQTGHDFVPYVQRTFPGMSREEIETPWFKADAGERTSLDVWKILGFKGDLKMAKPDQRIFKLTMEKLGCEASDCNYVDDRRGNLTAAKALGMDTILFNSRDVQYEGKTVNSFQELSDMLAR